MYVCMYIAHPTGLSIDRPHDVPRTQRSMRETGCAAAVSAMSRGASCCGEGARQNAMLRAASRARGPSPGADVHGVSPAAPVHTHAAWPRLPPDCVRTWRRGAGARRGSAGSRARSRTRAARTAHARTCRRSGACRPHTCALLCGCDIYTCMHACIHT